MTDARYMEVAERVLPCDNSEAYCSNGRHTRGCIARLIPAVAAAIQAEVERATREADVCWRTNLSRVLPQTTFDPTQGTPSMWAGIVERAIAQARAEERAQMECGHARVNLTDGVLDFPPSCLFCAALAERDAEITRLTNANKTLNLNWGIQAEAREKAEARVRELEEGREARKASGRATRELASILAVTNCTHITGPEAEKAACSDCIEDALSTGGVNRTRQKLATLEADLAAARGALKGTADLFVCCIDGGINEHAEECPYFDIAPPAPETEPLPNPLRLDETWPATRDRLIDQVRKSERISGDDLSHRVTGDFAPHVTAYEPIRVGGPCCDLMQGHAGKCWNRGEPKP